ncbi:MAG: tyrosine-protein phosphatase [Clostridia bacterium]|nr:tyrosine-protein phosphatase [Clostridia bacterium]
MYDKQQDYGVKYANINVDNFRDLGGIRLPCERVIRSDMIFRSGELYGLTEQDKAELDKLGINYIFDLRSVDEVDYKPDYVPQNATYYNIPASSSKRTMVVQIDKVVDMIPSWMPASICKSIFRAYFKHLYRKFPFDNPAYRKMFEVMDDGAKFLFHCTAGKDRTGVASMLILLALGADIDTVQNDYMLSNYYRQLANKRFVEQFADYKHYAKYRKILPMTCEVEMRYFNACYGKIIRKYGDVKKFLLNQYNIDDKRIDKWLHLYTFEGV